MSFEDPKNPGDLVSSSDRNAFVNDYVTHRDDTSIHFSDAPSDGTQYVRVDGGWQQVDVENAVGDSGEVQFTDGSGGFLSSPNFVWDDGNNALTIQNSSPSNPSFLAKKSFTSAGQSFFRFEATHVTDGFVQLSESASNTSIFQPAIQLRAWGLDGSGGIIQGQLPSDRDEQIDSFAALIFQGERVPNPGNKGSALQSINNANVFMVRNRQTPIFVGKANGDNYIPSPGKFGIGTKNPARNLHVNGNAVINSDLRVTDKAVFTGNGSNAENLEWNTNNGRLEIGSTNVNRKNNYTVNSTDGIAGYNFEFGNRNFGYLGCGSTGSVFAFDKSRAFWIGRADDINDTSPERDLYVSGNGGKVGIATSNPSKQLDVNGGSIFRDDVELNASGSGVILTSPSGTKFKMTVNDNGNLTTTQQ